MNAEKQQQHSRKDSPTFADIWIKQKKKKNNMNHLESMYGLRLVPMPTPYTSWAEKRASKGRIRSSFVCLLFCFRLRLQLSGLQMSHTTERTKNFISFLLDHCISNQLHVYTVIVLILKSYLIIYLFVNLFINSNIKICCGWSFHFLRGCHVFAIWDFN